MRTTSLLFSLSFATLLLACGDKDEATDDSAVDDTNAEGDADTDADADTDTDTDTDVQDVATMSGTVVDSDGAPLEGMRVNLCKQVCRTVVTDSTGTYEFADFEADPWVHAFDVVDPNQVLMTPLSMVKAAKDENRTDVTVAMLAPDNQVKVPTGTAQETDFCGVHITVSADELTLPFGTDGEAGGCAAVAEEHWMPWDELPGTPLKVWYLAPFDAVSEDGLSFWVETDLADGTYEAYAADYHHTEWSHAGTLTASGGTLTSDGTLHVLSTLVIVQE